MTTTICDLWILTYDTLPTDMRSPIFTSEQIEREIRRANREGRDGRTDWTAIDLEEVILEHLDKARAVASRYDRQHLRPFTL